MKFTFAPQSEPLPGYTIKRAIHRGGFGEVYYAITDAGKEVALKLLNQHTDIELRGVTQCLNLKHPNLVTIFDIKTDADDDHWIIMEYVSGDDLATVLRNHPQGLPIEKVTHWLEGITAGLNYLHDKGIVHRDLKPANIYSENEMVKVGDVGLSKFITESRRNAQTQSVGTVYYMAPEIANGRYGREVDVYSLGIMLFELITGNVPFEGESAGEILMKHLSAKPNLSPLPKNLRPVLAHALAKDPQKRTPSAIALLKEFKQALSGENVVLEIPEESFINTTRPPLPAYRMKEKDVLPIPEESFSQNRQNKKKKQTKSHDKPRSRKKSENIFTRMHRQQTESPLTTKNAIIKWLPAVFAVFAVMISSTGGKINTVLGPLSYGAILSLAAYGVLLSLAIRSVVRLFTEDHQASTPTTKHATVKLLSVVAICAIFNIFLITVEGGGIDADARISTVITSVFVASTSIFVASVFVAVVLLISLATRPAVRFFIGNHQTEGTTSSSDNLNNSYLHGGYLRGLQYEKLTHHTPRFISFRHRMTELTGSMTMAVFCTAMITAGLYFFKMLVVTPGEVALFGGVTLLASWGVMLISKLTEGSTLDNLPRRFVQMLMGAAIGIGAFYLSDLFYVSLSDVQNPAMFSSIGRLDLVESLVSPRQPTIAGFVIFFAVLFGIRRWWVQADSFRKKRFRVMSVAFTALLAWGISLIWYFPAHWAITWAATICSVVHLSSIWVPREDRWKIVRYQNKKEEKTI